ALVHPALARGGVRRVLVLGGGDGLALREVLKHGTVEHVDLVDLDPMMTTLFGEHPTLRQLHGDALRDPRVTVHNADAMEWLIAQRRAGAEPYDAAIVDLPDPNNFSLGKLYSRSFYRLLATHLRPDAIGVVQATSPYLAPRSFWCIVRTLDDAGLHPVPYHAHVPSFGDWGFVLIGNTSFEPPTRLEPGVPRRFLHDALLSSLFVFPADQTPPEVEVNHLNDQRLVHYYETDLHAPLGVFGPSHAALPAPET